MLSLYHGKSLSSKGRDGILSSIMDKKMIASIGVVGCIFLLVGIVSYFVMNQSLPRSSQNITTLPNVKTELSKTEKDYTDSSGFTFNYADNLSLEKKESTDSATYATVVLTEKNMDGNITITVADTKIKTTDVWLTQNKYASDSSTITQKQLGGLPATEVKTKEKIMLIAIDKGILFSIDTPFSDEEAFWTGGYETVSKSFAFVQPQTESSGASDVALGGDDVIIEEDIIE